MMPVWRCRKGSCSSMFHDMFAETALEMRWLQSENVAYWDNQRSISDESKVMGTAEQISDHSVAQWIKPRVRDL